MTQIHLVAPLFTQEVINDTGAVVLQVTYQHLQQKNTAWGHIQEWNILIAV